MGAVPEKARREVSNFAWVGLGFFVRSGSRILRGDVCHMAGPEFHMGTRLDLERSAISLDLRSIPDLEACIACEEVTYVYFRPHPRSASSAKRR